MGDFLQASPLDVEDRLLSWRLLLNVYNPAFIIQPRTDLFVQEIVKDAVDVSVGVGWRAVIVERLCNIPFQKNVPVKATVRGNRSVQPERLMLSNSYPASGRENIPTYYELICPMLDDTSVKNTEIVEVEIPPTRSRDQVTMKIAKSQFEAYPIFWFDGLHILNEGVFNSWESYFNWDYFEAIPLDLST